MIWGAGHDANRQEEQFGSVARRAKFDADQRPDFSKKPGLWYKVFQRFGRIALPGSLERFLPHPGRNNRSR
jgi:hypothetical protein